MKPATRVEMAKKNSGNVFADLELPDPQDALAKAHLAARICQAICERGLTQAAAAVLLGLDQPKISALVRGKLNGFSLERLIRLLNDLSQEVEIVIRPAKKADCRGGFRVVTAAT